MKRPPEFYEMIADDYLAALDLGEKPNKAIAEAYEVPHSTACRWVKVARERGLLGPQIIRYGSSTNPKIVAVAGALGVDPYALVSAIREFAGGELRVSPRKVAA